MGGTAGAIRIRELGDADLPAAFVIVHQLRDHLTEELFRDRLGRQRARGYVLFGGFDDDGVLTGVIGMRPVTTLARGDHLHVDDLVVDLALRGRDHGKQLLAFAERWAAERELASIFLDSRPEVIEFYARLGYEPHSATLMRKRVNGKSTVEGGQHV